MTHDFDRRKSLQELQQEDWGEPAYDSCLVTTVHRLRQKPLADLTVEELRIVIGQAVGLPFLIPLAVERLEDHPLVAGDYYAGDLLQEVLRVDDAYWADHSDQLHRVRKIVQRAKELLPSLNEIDRSTALEVLAIAPRSLVE